MTAGFRIEVRRPDDTVVSRGTGWFLRPGLVATALHVVGKTQPRGWAHEVPAQDDVAYWLGDEQRWMGLHPLCFDALADVALLRCDDRTTGALVAVSDLAEQGAQWYADARPGFDRNEAWTLSGRIVNRRGDRLQLLVDQGSQVGWAGVSGSAVVVNDAIVGLITAETSGTNTIWATATAPITRLAAQYDSALENVADDPNRLVETLDAIGRRPTAWSVDPAVLSSLHSWGIGPISAGSTRLVRREISETNATLYDAWDEFDELLSTRYPSERFGGRVEQLSALETFLESTGGYFFVTGYAGLGKTALMAEWLRSLRRRGDRPVFHFITARPSKFIEKPYTEHVCLDKLCRQLLDLYGLGGELPRESDSLRRLYAQMLTVTPPPNERVIVVLDGLDEALRDWTPSRGMFPDRLADRVYVVFSARRMANRNWLADLKLTLPPARQWNLERLRREEVGDVLARSACVTDASDEATLDVIWSVTNGDPDYVADVINLLQESRGDLAAIRDLPSKHSEYLQQWWDEAYASAQDSASAFEDLMGTLSVLREPFLSDDLADISETDHLRKGNIRRLIDRAKRYIDGDPNQGYFIGRSRILQLIAERLEDRIEVYRDGVVAFCQRWNSKELSRTSRAYALRNGIPHLLEVNRVADARGLITAEWLAARWDAESSYSGVIEDIDRLLSIVPIPVEDEAGIPDAGADQITPEEAQQYSHVAALAIGRETARELMAQLPVALLRTLVRLEEIRQVTRLVSAFSQYRGRASQPLIAVARELLEGRDRFKEPVDVESLVPPLVSRALGMLTRIRATQWQLDGLQEAVRVLTTYPKIGKAWPSLVHQARALADTLGGIPFRACARAEVARLAAGHASTRHQALELLDDTEHSMFAAMTPGERASFWSHALPALRAVQPERVRAVIEQLLEPSTFPALRSSIDTSVQTTVLQSWVAGVSEDTSWSASPLERLADAFASGSQEFSPVVLVKLFCATGRYDKADDIVRHALQKAPGLGVECMMAFVEASDQDLEGRLKRLQWVASLLGNRVADSQRSRLAEGYARVGAWDSALEQLGMVNARDRLQPLVACIERAGALTETALQKVAILRRLSELDEGLDHDSKTTVDATVACELALVDKTEARRALRRAHRILSRLPEGSTDDLLHLWAVSLAEEGHRAEARALVPQSESRARAIGICADIVKATSSSIPREDFVQTTDLALERIPSGHGQPFDVTTVTAAVELAEALPPSLADYAKALCDRIRQNFSSTHTNEYFAATIAELRIRVRIDPEDGRRGLDELMARVHATELSDIGLHNWRTLCELLISIRAVDPEVDHHFSDVQHRLDTSTSEKDLGYRGVYAGAVSEVNPEQALRLFAAIVTDVERTAPSRPVSAEGFIRMVAELFNTPITSVTPWSTTLAAVAAAKGVPADARETLMRRLIDSFAALPLDPFDRIRAVPSVLESAARLPEAEEDVLRDLIESTFRAAVGSLDPPAFSGMVVDTLMRVSKAGHAALAYSLLSHIPVEAHRRQAEFEVGGVKARQSAMKGAAGRFEQILFSIDKTEVVAALMAQLTRKQSAALILRGMSEPNDEVIRRAMLGWMAPSVMLLLRTAGPPGAVDTFARSIIDIDKAVQRAGDLIARPA